MQEALLNTRCLAEACRRRGVLFRVHDQYGNVVSFRIGERDYFFANFTTPFNNDGVSRLCKDKEFSYRLLKDAVPIPLTRGFFDPQYEDARFAHYKEEKSISEITAEILAAFALPVIVKMNSGTRGINVYKCTDAREVERSLTAIFNPRSRYYDYIALAQEYIPPAREYRVIIFRGAVLLAYEKDISHARFVGNLSPLHWEGARAVHLTDVSMLAQFERFLTPAFRALPVEFCGADLIEDAHGAWFLLELNTMPGFYRFAQDNSEELVVAMYEKIISAL